MTENFLEKSSENLKDSDITEKPTHKEAVDMNDKVSRVFCCEHEYSSEKMKRWKDKYNEGYWYYECPKCGNVVGLKIPKEAQEEDE